MKGQADDALADAVVDLTGEAAIEVADLVTVPGADRDCVCVERIVRLGVEAQLVAHQSIVFLAQAENEPP